MLMGVLPDPTCFYVMIADNSIFRHNLPSSNSLLPSNFL